MMKKNFIKPAALALSTLAAIAATPVMAESEAIARPLQSANKLFGIQADKLNLIDDAIIDGWDVVQVKNTAEFIFVTEDGRFVLLNGNLIDVESNTVINQTVASRLDQAFWVERKSLFNFDFDLIEYKADDEKTSIIVVTDPSCPYCRKLHAAIPELNKAGITVKYALFPRSGLDSDMHNLMGNIWTNPDRKAVLEKAFETRPDEYSSLLHDSDEETESRGLDEVKQMHEAAVKAGLSGTPFIVTAMGRKDDGFVSPERLIEIAFDNGL